MEAFAAATNAQPQSKEELQRVLDELPRKELQALGKSHGVKATLKRESLVGKLMGVLPAQLWPSSAVEQEGIQEEGEEEVDSVGEEVVEAKQEEKEESTKVTTEDEVTGTLAVAEEQAPPTELTPTEPTPTEEASKTKHTNGAKKTTSAVGKKAVATNKKQAVGTSGSPKKPVKTTGVKATAAAAATKATTLKVKTTTTTTTTSTRTRVARQVTTPSKSPSKVLDKIHAKQTAPQPTLQQHESAKKARATALLASKVSAVKKTRSQTKKAEAAAAASSVTKTLNFGPPKTPVKTPMKAPMRTPMKTPTKTPAKKSVQSTEAAPGTPNATTKKGGSFTPYKGPVPVFTGESSFTPKKPTVRPAPMAVAVMKAARVTRPKTQTPAKPSRTSDAAANKENTSPTTDGNAQPSKTEKTTSSPRKKAPVSQVSSRLMKSTVAAEAKKTVAARTSVKTSTTQVVTQESKKEERRSKFAAQAKAKSAATRRESRASTAVTSKE